MECLVFGPNIYFYSFAFLVEEITGFSWKCVSILWKRQDVRFGLFWLVTFPTASGISIIRTLHSLSYKVLIRYSEAAARVHIGRIFPAYFLVYSFVGNRGKQTSGWLQIMESFSVLWWSFLLVNVQFLVWKVGGYLLLIIKIFLLFEKDTSCFNSFSSQLKVLCVNCHTICVVTYGRRTQKEKKLFMHVWLLLLPIKSVSSETNLWTPAYVEISSWYF